jgi:RNA polymerase sigma factor (TIGR02999 family)
MAGDSTARRRLMELVYDELRGLAADLLARERPEHTLQPTALVHEAYVRLIGQERAEIRSRTHFVALAAEQMRRVLVDHARVRLAEKRGGGQVLERLRDDLPSPWGDPANLVALDQALVRLARVHPRAAQVVELRFFGGMTLQDVGAVLGLSRETVKLDWRLARAWLTDALARPDVT